MGINVTVRSMNDAQLYHLWYDFDWDLILYSWGTNPDPDFLLSTFTSHECGSWSDTCYHNTTYDRLYLKQQTSVDMDERQKIVDEMQQMLYRDVPEVVLWYPNAFEAWRADRWTGFVNWPEPDGVVFWYNTFSARWVQPKAGAGVVQQEPGPSGFFWIAAFTLTTVLILLAASRRRRMDAYYA